ncbi:MAG: FAD:protein FMN transferase [Planctomycetes bacterium]|nr:FAD:protein FMN transferase [Planctomycetota bacterium]
MRRALLALLLLALPLQAEVYLTREQALHLAFPDASARVARKTGELEWWRFEREGKLLGYATISQVQGKAQPITFLLSADPQLHIRGIEILEYRESHGAEIRREDWRAQFVGKDSDAPLRVGRDVRNIAGATISCRSLTNGVRARLEDLKNAVAREPAGTAGVPVEASSPAPVRRSQLLMGTTLTLTLDATADEHSEAALQAAFDEVRRLEGLLSDWDPQSELSRLGRAGAAQLGPELEDVLGRSLEIAERSQGAFDPSVGALVSLWRGARSVPGADERVRALASVGWRTIELDRTTHHVRLHTRGTALDLGGIGKGFALDRAARILRAHACPRALLDFGGQLLALDAPQGRKGWPVAVRDPRGGERPLFELELCSASLATTSDEQRGLVIEGQRFSHVIDPRSGLPVEGRLAACVLAPDATSADAWSTALFVLGSASGIPLAEREGLAARVEEADASVHETAAMTRARTGEKP